MTSKILQPGDTGTVLVADVDESAVVTRDLDDEDRTRAAVAEYAEAYENEEPIPPIDVFLVAGRMVLVDGWHRLAARVLMGSCGVVARCVGEGTLEDALVHALRATNRAHGLRLSPADCRRRVFQALDSGRWDGSSARQIARDLCINRRTVGKYMREWEAEQTARGAPGLSPTVVDSAGREQPRRRGAVHHVEEGAPEEEGESLDNPANGAAEADPVEPPSAVAPSSGDEPPEPPAEDRASRPAPPETPVPMPDDAEALSAIRERFRRARLLARESFGDDDSRRSLLQRLEDSAERAERACEYAEAVICPECEGAGCRRCGDRGWATKVALCR